MQQELPYGCSIAVVTLEFLLSSKSVLHVKQYPSCLASLRAEAVRTTIIIQASVQQVMKTAVGLAVRGRCNYQVEAHAVMASSRMLASSALSDQHAHMTTTVAKMHQDPDSCLLHISALSSQHTRYFYAIHMKTVAIPHSLRGLPHNLQSFNGRNLVQVEQASALLSKTLATRCKKRSCQA